MSPLLSNILLADRDRELEKRGHRFVRYADDCNIYVGSAAAGQRVMQSITRYVHRRLKLRVNPAKSAVARPQARKLLGFSFTGGATSKRRIAPKALLRFKQRVRELTRRTKGVHAKQLKQLTAYLRGWQSYFGFCQTPSVMARLAEWVRRRLRATFWKQWKRGTTRYAELRRRGVARDLAAQTAGSCHGPWRLGNSPALAIALPNAFFRSLGLPPLAVRT